MLRVLLLLTGLGIGWTLAPGTDSTPPPGARLVRAEVRFAGELLLQASTSDDGHPDVDAVWNYLPGLVFEATPAFTKLRAARQAGEAGEAGKGDWTLRRREDDGWIDLRIDYGGRGELRALSFVRDGERWRLVADEVAGQADRRWIRRSAVAALGGRKTPAER